MSSPGALPRGALAAGMTTPVVTRKTQQMADRKAAVEAAQRDAFETECKTLPGKLLALPRPQRELLLTIMETGKIPATSSRGLIGALVRGGWLEHSREEWPDHHPYTLTGHGLVEYNDHLVKSGRTLRAVLDEFQQTSRP